MTPEIYYRVHDFLVSSGIDEWGNALGQPRVELATQTFSVLKITPKGVWLDYYGTRRFVLNEARKSIRTAVYCRSSRFVQSPQETADKNTQIKIAQCGNSTSDGWAG